MSALVEFQDGLTSSAPRAPGNGHTLLSSLVLPEVNELRSRTRTILLDVHRVLVPSPILDQRTKDEIQVYAQKVDKRSIASGDGASSVAHRGEVNFRPSAPLLEYLTQSLAGNSWLDRLLLRHAGLCPSASEVERLAKDALFGALETYFRFLTQDNSRRTRFALVDEDQALLVKAIGARLGNVNSTSRFAIAKHLLDEFVSALENRKAALSGVMAYLDGGTLVLEGLRRR